MDVRHWHQAMQHCTHLHLPSSQPTRLWFLSWVSDYFWAGLHIQLKVMKITSAFQTHDLWNVCIYCQKCIVNIMKKSWKSIWISQYLLHWFNKLFICISWMMEQSQRSLCRNWGGTTYMRQQISKNTDTGQHIWTVKQAALKNVMKPDLQTIK